MQPRPVRPHDREGRLERLDRLLALAAERVRASERVIGAPLREQRPDPLRDVHRLLSVRGRGGDVAAETREIDGALVRPAEDLELAVLPRETEAAIEGVVRLVAPRHVRQEPSAVHHEPDVRAVSEVLGPHSDVRRHVPQRVLDDLERAAEVAELRRPARRGSRRRRGAARAGRPAQRASRPATRARWPARRRRRSRARARRRAGAARASACHRGARRACVPRRRAPAPAFSVMPCRGPRFSTPRHAASASVSASSSGNAPTSSRTFCQWCRPTAVSLWAAHSAARRCQRAACRAFAGLLEVVREQRRALVDAVGVRIFDRARDRRMHAPTALAEHRVVRDLLRQRVLEPVLGLGEAAHARR